MERDAVDVHAISPLGQHACHTVVAVSVGLVSTIVTAFRICGPAGAGTNAFDAPRRCVQVKASVTRW
jgi:hypothetical protein